MSDYTIGGTIMDRTQTKGELLAELETCEAALHRAVDIVDVQIETHIAHVLKALDIPHRRDVGGFTVVVDGDEYLIDVTTVATYHSVQITARVLQDRRSTSPLFGSDTTAYYTWDRSVGDYVYQINTPSGAGITAAYIRSVFSTALHIFARQSEDQHYYVLRAAELGTEWGRLYSRIDEMRPDASEAV
jgi:hypothetical protein